MEGVIRKLANGHHIEHGRGLIVLSRINHVEVDYTIVLDVVGEEVVDDVLVRRSRTLQPKGVGLRRVLHWGHIISQA